MDVRLPVSDIRISKQITIMGPRISSKSNRVTVAIRKQPRLQLEHISYRNCNSNYSCSLIRDIQMLTSLMALTGYIKHLKDAVYLIEKSRLPSRQSYIRSVKNCNQKHLWYISNEKPIRLSSLQPNILTATDKATYYAGIVPRSNPTSLDSPHSDSYLPRHRFLRLSRRSLCIDGVTRWLGGRIREMPVRDYLIGCFQSADIVWYMAGEVNPSKSTRTSLSTCIPIWMVNLLTPDA